MKKGTLPFSEKGSVPFFSDQGAAHSGQFAWERAQYANVPSQLKQQTRPLQLHPDAWTVGVQLSAATPKTATTSNAIDTSLFINPPLPIRRSASNVRMR